MACRGTHSLSFIPSPSHANRLRIRSAGLTYQLPPCPISSANCIVHTYSVPFPKVLKNTEPVSLASCIYVSI